MVMQQYGVISPLKNRIMTKTYHKIIRGDSRCMKEVRHESVHLVVTSPPYWQLKDYGTENQIGFHDDYETYINHLNLVWSECHRVLHKGCRLCINIGDQFARSVYSLDFKYKEKFKSLLDGEIANKEVIPAIELEINRLTATSQVVSRRS